MICFSKNSRIFALELNLRNSIRVFIVTIFFISANQNSLGCCFPLDSRCKTLLTFAGSGNDSLFLFNNIISSTMRKSTNECSTGKSITEKNTPYSAKTVPTGTPADITVIVTGKRNNRIIHAYWKMFYEFMIEETCGHIFAETRFVKKYEAANLLYPEDRKALRGLTVKFK